MLHRPLIVALCALALFAFGCGGDDGDEGAAGAAGAAAGAAPAPESATGATGIDGASSASGSRGDAVVSPVKPISMRKARYVRQADRVCARQRRAALRKIGAFSQEERDDGPEQMFEAMSVEILAPAHEQKAEALRALGAPRRDVPDIETLLVVMRQESAELAADPPQNLDEYTEQLSGSVALARQYGLTECASVRLL